MMAIIVHFEAKPDKIEAFKEAIVGHATRCLEREPGCLQFDVVQDPKNPALFAVYEIYKDRHRCASREPAYGGDGQGHTGPDHQARAVDLKSDRGREAEALSAIRPTSGTRMA